MKRFGVKALIFIVVFVLVDRLIYLFLQKQRPIDYELFLESKKDFFENDYNLDLLIIGSSEISDALDPRTLENYGGLKSYNLGVYHSSPFENYYLAKSALNHLDQKPKIVVLGISPIMFERNLSKGKYTPIILHNNIELVMNSEEGFDRSFFFKNISGKVSF